MLLSPSRHAYRDHTGRRIDPLLRLHRVTLAEARRRELDLQPESEVPPVTAVTSTAGLSMLPVPWEPDDPTEVASEWYAISAALS